MLSSEIRYFLAVVQCGSLSAASEQLFVAVSAISRQIQRLETQVGVPLFERHARGMVLNEAGEIFSHHVRKSQLDMEYALAEIKGLKAIRRSLIRIACTDGMAFSLLPGLLAEFRQANPGVLFALNVTHSQGVAACVRAGECDVALQFSLQPERSVEVLGSWPAPVLLAMHQLHPLASRQVTLADLHGWPLALPGQHTTVRQLFDLSCQMNDCVVEPVLTCDYFATLYHFLLHTPQAVTICSAFTLLFERDTQNLVLRSMGVDQLSQRTLQLQTVSGRQRNAALTLFLQFLQQRLMEMDQQVRMG
ncbi:DNA-binding transcriptional LysR family regulator [Pantoea agglomerans]|uniref:LysR family transcriptional regulator n=1 Tax=Enterobacter agglomerans TaxID=549 RepID=UPI0015F99F10|nr:LysR family transcriptional regulator [Pantoea agglomerans]MBA8865145.1 DNA-binding transcriptional LysR family regulator [Pantoea agglomerans]MBA8892458.1 DNA-binding transcriptional LysR family regulator [Pantoea agglomerans]